ncbi:hypothetical protein PAMA_016226 [Pampus argenteus]
MRRGEERRGEERRGEERRGEERRGEERRGEESYTQWHTTLRELLKEVISKTDFGDLQDVSLYRHLEVMNGMGNLQVTKEGVRLEGVSEFLLPLYVEEIQSRRDSPLILQSDRNVTVNARNDQGQLTGSEMVEAQCQRFEVRSADGERVLFSADEEEISIGTEKLRVTGNEGVVFSHSVETSHVRAEPFQDLKLESPTRTLTMEAPRGVEVNAGVGDFTASCRKDLLLQSSEGEIFLDANTIRLGNIPLGSVVDPLEGAPAGTTYTKQTVYELCACANGKLYLSPAEKGSTCQTTSNFCLWS